MHANLHIRIRRWTSDLQVHSHVALLAIVQTFGAQVQVHFWRTFNLNLGTECESESPVIHLWHIMKLITEVLNSAFSCHLSGIINMGI